MPIFVAKSVAFFPLLQYQDGAYTMLIKHFHIPLRNQMLVGVKKKKKALVKRTRSIKVESMIKLHDKRWLNAYKGFLYLLNHWKHWIMFSES